MCVRHSTLLVVKTKLEGGQKLTGTIPTELFLLSDLEYIDLSKYDGNV